MNKKILRSEKTDLAIAVLREFKKMPNIPGVAEISTGSYCNCREQDLSLTVFFDSRFELGSKNIYEASWAEYRNTDDLVLYTGWTEKMWEDGVPDESSYTSKRFFPISGKNGSAGAAKRAAAALYDSISAAAQAAVNTIASLKARQANRKELAEMGVLG